MQVPVKTSSPSVRLALGGNQRGTKIALQNIDDEIGAVVELGRAKSSLIDSLFKAGGG